MIFDVGDTAYILENCIRVRPVIILNRIGDMYTVRIGSGATRVRHTRLFANKEEAEKHLVKLSEPKINTPNVEESRSGYRSPYDFWY